MANIADIETFFAVAQGGSFAAAAKRLRLTPSAVSRAIARLEGRLGVVLLRRTTRSLALTPEGERYRARMTALLAEMADVEAGLGRERQGPCGGAAGSMPRTARHELPHSDPAALQRSLS